jgi:hypothetical protein
MNEIGALSFNQRNSILFSVLLLIGMPCLAIDNPHFYRANFFWQEVRFDKPWLTSFDIPFAGGSTTTARNQEGEKTSLLNIYGPSHMKVLGENVPTLNPANPLDLILIDLIALPDQPNFGYLGFDGHFTTIELPFNVYQNVCNGFFLQAYWPLRHLQIRSIAWTDLTPTTGFPNKETPAWQAFLANFPAIMRRWGQSISSFSTTAMGDLTLLAGWSHTHVDTCSIDYIDVSTKIGVLLPTGRPRSLTNPFSLPSGYNGHYGMPLKFVMGIGYWEWLTLGLHIGALFLFDQTAPLKVKTAADQNGFIKLAQTNAKIDAGTLWDIAGYVKADHFLRGLSLFAGYTYTRKDADCIKVADTSLSDPLIINSDPQYRGWQMHVLHWIVEYDFTHCPIGFGGRASFFYNQIIGGKRIFNTGMTGFLCGFDYSWCF